MITGFEKLLTLLVGYINRKLESRKISSFGFRWTKVIYYFWSWKSYSVISELQLGKIFSVMFRQIVCSMTIIMLAT